MAKLLHVIALFLCSATLLVAYPAHKFREMSPEVRASFVDYMKAYQPFRIDRSWEPVGWMPGYLHWPRGIRNVFIGADMYTHPELGGFTERRTWHNLYMDDDTMAFLQRIERELRPLISPDGTERWFRAELSQAVDPLNRPQYPMPRIIRNLVTGMLSRSGQTNPQIIQRVHAGVRQIVDHRYQPGSYDGPPPPSPFINQLARAFLY